MSNDELCIVNYEKSKVYFMEREWAESLLR